MIAAKIEDGRLLRPLSKKREVDSGHTTCGGRVRSSAARTRCQPSAVMEGSATIWFPTFYIAPFSRFTTCGSWEAHNILDYLVENDSDVRPDTIHADTQGESAAIFELAHLLGIPAPA